MKRSACLLEESTRDSQISNTVEVVEQSNMSIALEMREENFQNDGTF